MTPKDETLAERLIGQLVYVSDEIDMLSKFLPRIDPTILNQNPIDGEMSVLENFRQMVVNQESLLSELGLDIKDGDELTDDLAVVLNRFKIGRDKLVEIVHRFSDRSVPVVFEDERVAGLLYDLIIEESSLMRSVTVRLHESNMFRL